MRLTIAVPQTHIDIANHYAMAVGYSKADSLTYRDPSWQDAQGNLYACASLPISSNFLSRATSPLTRPEWDADEIIDMVKASQAQALVALWMPEDDPITATPDTITAIAGKSGSEAIAFMGLTQVKEEQIRNESWG